eukprot:3678992-Rhodomonas_salina.5
MGGEERRLGCPCWSVRTNWSHVKKVASSVGARRSREVLSHYKDQILAVPFVKRRSLKPQGGQEVCSDSCQSCQNSNEGFCQPEESFVKKPKKDCCRSEEG